MRWRCTETGTPGPTAGTRLVRLPRPPCSQQPGSRDGKGLGLGSRGSSWSGKRAGLAGLAGRSVGPGLRRGGGGAPAGKGRGSSRWDPDKREEVARHRPRAGAAHLILSSRFLSAFL